MKKQKFPRRFVFVLGLLTLVGAAAFSLSPGVSGQKQSPPARAQVRQELDKALSSYDELSLDPATVNKQVRQTGRLTLNTSHGEFDLALEPYDLRAANYRAEVWGEGGVVREIERAPVRTYKGTVGGMKNAQARFTIDEQTLEGVIITPDVLYFVEAAKGLAPAAGATDFVFYADSSVKQESFGECGVTLAQEVRAEAARALDGRVALKAAGGPTMDELFGPALEIEIATEADFEYFTAFNSNETTANEAIVSILNNVEGIYNGELGLQFRIVFSRVWSTSNDPYTLTAAGPALTEFRNSYNSSFLPSAPPARDLVHLFTGKNLDGTTIGIAYTGGYTCPDSGFGYGISQNITGNRAGLTAHEIGHNFGAAHTDGVAGCEGTIMNPSITPSTTFCQFSRDQITNQAVENSSCLTQLVAPGCAYSISPNSAVQFGSGGGAGSINITAGAGCAWAVAEGLPWLTATSSDAGTGNGVFNYTVSANTGGPRAGRIDIAGQKLTVRQTASAACGSTPISAGQTINGQLSTSDCRAGQPERPNAFIDIYTFNGLAGQQVRVEMSAASAATLDTYLYLFGPGGNLVAENDDIVLAQNTNSRIPVNGFLTLPETGAYTIVATSFEDNETGDYSLTLTVNAPANSIAFSSSTYTVSEGTQGDGTGTEGTGFVTINVTRAGDVSGAASVDFATSDGTAESRKDYTKALGALRFAPNDTSESFTILVTDDRFAEGIETINLTLSNPVGASLGAVSNAVVNITSANDAANGPSPVRDASFNAPFFVRQQYHDFLNREPDVAGLNFWVGQTTGCGNPDLLVCRVNTSAAFFLSIEFQETGYFVYRLYKAAYGDILGAPVPVRFDEFLRDTLAARAGVVVGVGNWQQQLETNKNALAAEFATRARFNAANPAGLTAEQFVDGLFAKAGVAPQASERQAAITAFGAGGRGGALRAVAEAQTLKDAEFNKAFVLLQYFGYLRRDPDAAPNTDFSGYNFWLGKLNQFGGNFVQAEMVRAFISSSEYTDRFGQ